MTLYDDSLEEPVGSQAADPSDVAAGPGFLAACVVGYSVMFGFLAYAVDAVLRWSTASGRVSSVASVLIFLGLAVTATLGCDSLARAAAYLDSAPSSTNARQRRRQRWMSPRRMIG